MSDERKTQVLVDGVRRTFQISGSELVVPCPSSSPVVCSSV